MASGNTKPAIRDVQFVTRDGPGNTQRLLIIAAQALYTRKHVKQTIQWQSRK
jgi:hypothetical protein